ncbi:DUF6115 domain-containing protein [Halobacillus sp. A5]|uniref:DUF6115 domain-containing protein n=1 Tax=Halobacillus sp. A5 TaxID=2880263 RepID=UPI0020A6D247|nr:hypothetical protein [Halobacillus sp. A5]MCP3026095.1 hypothetical protein [Halobacillus sp. A5]
MIYFLLIISFIVDGLLIYALFTIFTKVKKSEEIELRQQEVAREIEDLFSSYLLEIKEENKRLESKLTSTSFRAGEGAGKQQEEYTPPEPENDEPEYQLSPQSKVISLHNRGHSINDIAKKLNLGITETQLIVKFHKRN